MNWRHDAFKLLVTGQSGSGKTEYWARYVYHTLAPFKFVFDAEGEFWRRFGVTPCLTYEQIDRAVECSRLVVFDPLELYPGRLEDAWQFFCQYTFAVAKSVSGRKLICIDELQKYIQTDTVPYEFAVLWDTGRRYETDFAIIAQQPNTIHNRLRNNFTEVVTFLQLDNRALEYLVANGFPVDVVRTLAPHAYLARNMRSGAIVSGLLQW